MQLLTVLEVGLILMRRYFTSETSGFAYLRATHGGWMDDGEASHFSR